MKISKHRDEYPLEMLRTRRNTIWNMLRLASSPYSPIRITKSFVGIPIVGTPTASVIAGTEETTATATETGILIGTEAGIGKAIGTDIMIGTETGRGRRIEIGTWSPSEAEMRIASAELTELVNGEGTVTANVGQIVTANMGQIVNVNVTVLEINLNNLGILIVLIWTHIGSPVHIFARKNGLAIMEIQMNPLPKDPASPHPSKRANLSDFDSVQLCRTLCHI
jgi:hypothetical protein